MSARAPPWAFAGGTGPCRRGARTAPLAADPTQAPPPFREQEAEQARRRDQALLDRNTGDVGQHRASLPSRPRGPGGARGGTRPRSVAQYDGRLPGGRVAPGWVTAPRPEGSAAHDQSDAMGRPAGASTRAPSVATHRRHQVIRGTTLAASVDAPRRCAPRESGCERELERSGAHGSAPTESTCTNQTHRGARADRPRLGRRPSPVRCRHIPARVLAPRPQGHSRAADGAGESIGHRRASRRPP